VILDIGEQRRPGSGAGKRAQPKLCLTLRDDGSGFSLSVPKSFTLATMSERVRSLGGTCMIEGAAPAGASIRIEIPVPRKKVARARPLELVRNVT
jgi:two-component system sensor histidine kinase UhpB